VLFVSVERKKDQQTVTTDGRGSFSAKLRAGGWLAYTYDERGRPVFLRRVEVKQTKAAPITLVSR